VSENSYEDRSFTDRDLANPPKFAPLKIREISVSCNKGGLFKAQAFIYKLYFGFLSRNRGTGQLFHGGRKQGDRSVVSWWA